MWQANCVRATPWNELELNEPVQFGHGFVAHFPISVQAKHFVLGLVDHQDVGSHLALRKAVILKLKPRINVENAAQTILVLVAFTSLNLVCGFLRATLLRFRAGADVADVAVQASFDAVVEFPLGDVLNLRNTLCGIEVCGGKGQQDVVNGNKFGAGAAKLFIKPQLEVL